MSQIDTYCKRAGSRRWQGVNRSRSLASFLVALVGIVACLSSASRHLPFVASCTHLQYHTSLSLCRCKSFFLLICQGNPVTALVLQLLFDCYRQHVAAVHQPDPPGWCCTLFDQSRRGRAAAFALCSHILPSQVRYAGLANVLCTYIHNPSAARLLVASRPHTKIVHACLLAICISTKPCSCAVVMLHGSWTAV
jgi:hypothetical protein